jgi:acyl dehydratase
MPQREPEVAEAGPEQSIDMPTVPGQALLYRLSGDHNPLHSDPAIAAEAGFPRPILHGLCSFGMAGRAAVRLLCSGDGSRLRRLIVRFSAPAWPGERMLFTLKRSRAGQAHLRAQSAGRDILTRGVIEFQPGQTVSFGQDSPISEE